MGRQQKLLDLRAERRDLVAASAKLNLLLERSICSDSERETYSQYVTGMGKRINEIDQEILDMGPKHGRRGLSATDSKKVVGERGEISVALILLISFLSGVGIVVIDHELSKAERRKAQAKLQAESGVDWDKGDYVLEELR